MKLYAKVKLNGKWTFVQTRFTSIIAACECRECQREVDVE